MVRLPHGFHHPSELGCIPKWPIPVHCLPSDCCPELRPQFIATSRLRKEVSIRAGIPSGGLVAHFDLSLHSRDRMRLSWLRKRFASVSGSHSDHR